ncbi:TPA: SACOL1771 family peroxiredoxin [Staphylococcus aureus]|uniref:SACOL1771 family peroxiredoxin n=1 Tax=Staphylococcus aureus TaxID=1280 RepID=UPI00077C2346|nr:SACOL1771 family peroxiredoxin [Staphylococcus aureus]ELK7146491.1 SACOL1771 family peroxiredoxin [Staphylococcus aureus]MBA6031432.1 SACOL1771 family peroxiredoxin [Staphylococcus aureus]MBO8545136.1 SACOL1771 family peroxiredoxin [Staphylococcus aureus]MCC0938725.1 SACOL1771 family peroxiredoxin [Staphylococcus aureus]MCG5154501.1 SACOL1771 family peroxiredoxin [Staphylococcus aureus]
MHQHDFKVKTSWQGGRNNVGNVQGDILSENISIPASLGGVGIGTNPDEMLVSAASSCYIISLAATLERAKFTDISIEQQSIGTACLNNGKFSMSKIVHHSHIQIPSDQIAQLEKRLPKLITIADNNCMISNAVRNNVDIKIYPIIQAK